MRVVMLGKCGSDYIIVFEEEDKYIRVNMNMHEFKEFIKIVKFSENFLL